MLVWCTLDKASALMLIIPGICTADNSKSYTTERYNIYFKEFNTSGSFAVRLLMLDTVVILSDWTIILLPRQRYPNLAAARTTIRVSLQLMCSEAAWGQSWAQLVYRQ